MNKTIDQRLENIEKRVAAIEEASLKYVATAATVVSKVKKQSSKEFLMTKNAKAETQKVLALGYYLEYVQGMGSFNTSDLVDVFHSAKEKLPKNINDAVNKNIVRGFLMDAADKKDTKKAWVITSTGEKYVEDELKNSN